MGAILFLGGARSGKSRAAERFAEDHGGQVTAVVFGKVGVDDEFDRRIEDHRRSRPDSWITVEVTDAASWTVDVGVAKVIVIDCVGTWLSSLAETEGYPEAERLLVARCGEIVGHPDLSVIFVSNEVGSSLTPITESGRAFTDALGRINQRLAAICTTTFLCVAGLTLPLNDLNTNPSWRNVE